MDRFKGLAKGGWHPPGDPSISRKTWKSDLKGMATGQKKDPYEQSRNHESRPLASLRDPDSFGPPPKHSAYYGAGASTPSRTNTGSPSSGGGLGGPVPAPRRITQQEEVEEEEAAKPPPGPYRTDTTGLRTDNLPPPPVRRAGTGSSSPGPAPPPRNRPNPALPGRAPVPAPAAATPPPRAAAAKPPPMLPPRQNEYPDEFTPPPPPSYGEATQPAAPSNSASLNQSAVNRLGQAGVSVPGFGIGNNAAPTDTPSAQGHPNQLSELQQRFSRLGTGSPHGAQPPSGAPAPSWQQRQQPQPIPSSQYSGQQTGVIPPAASPGAAAAAAKKKPAPPPPPKKSTLQTNDGGDGPAPPPVPMSSKPKPS